MGMFSVYRVDKLRLIFVLMIVMVGIEGDLSLGAMTKKLQECRIERDLCRMAVAANMLVETNYCIGVGHHQMQVVRDQQNTTAEFVAQFANQGVKGSLAGNVNTLHRLVKHQQFGTFEQRTRQ